MPLGTVHTGAPSDLKAIAAMVKDHGATVVVLGLPVSLSGARGPAARKAEAFAEALRSLLSVPVELQDERFSTVEAERLLRAAGVGGRDRRNVVDGSAATIILQAWIDAHR